MEHFVDNTVYVCANKLPLNSISAVVLVWYIKHLSYGFVSERLLKIVFFSSQNLFQR